MPRFNERIHSATKINRMNELFEAIKDSRDPLMQEVADEIHLRRTFGCAIDSQESEQQSFDPSDSDKNVSNAQSHYDSEKQRLRNFGTNGNSFDKNRAEVMRESRHATPLSDANASKAKDVSAFARHPDQPSFNSGVVFDSFREGHGNTDGLRTLWANLFSIGTGGLPLLDVALRFASHVSQSRAMQV